MSIGQLKVTVRVGAACMAVTNASEPIKIEGYSETTIKTLDYEVPTSTFEKFTGIGDGCSFGTFKLM